MSESWLDKMLLVELLRRLHRIKSCFCSVVPPPPLPSGELEEVLGSEVQGPGGESGPC